jgi:hypothetical protein
LAKLPLFGFLTRPVQVVFPAHCDVLALQVAEHRTPPADKGVFATGIPAIAVNRAWPTSVSPTWDATLAVALNFNSSGSPTSQGANNNLYGPGATVSMYGRDFIIGSVVNQDWLWSQGPACNSGLNGTNHTYSVRGYMFWNLTLIKKTFDITNLDFVCNFSGCSGSIYEVWGEVLHGCRSVNYANLGSTTMTKAASMGWDYKSMLYHAKGIGQPTITTGETDALTPEIILTCDMQNVNYQLGFNSSGFGGNANNVFTSTGGTGSD